MDSIISILVKQFNMRQQCSTPPNTRWVEESLTPAVRVVCSTLLHHSQVTQRILCVTIITLPGAKRHCSRKEDSFSHKL